MFEIFKKNKKEDTGHRLILWGKESPVYVEQLFHWDRLLFLLIEEHDEDYYTKKVIEGMGFKIPNEMHEFILNHFKEQKESK